MEKGVKVLKQNHAKEKFLILDGNSLTHRAYHAINSLTTSQGVPTNAVYGFTNMLLKLIEEEQPDYVGVAFDKGRITFRHEVYADYKGHRSATPEDLRPQFPLIKRVLKAMRIPVFELENYEADDLIGTLVHLAEEKGLQSTIISGDRDVLQLVSPVTHVLITRRGISVMEAYDVEQIAEKYGGLAPQQLIDIKALEGDASDNIPGVPSVGPKTAQKLIRQYASIERLLEHRAEIRGKLSGLLNEYSDQIHRSKWLATIVRDVPIQVNWKQCQYRGPNYQELIQAFRELEFRTLIKRITTAMPGSARTELEVPVETEARLEPELMEHDYWRITEEDDLEALVEEIETWRKQAQLAGETPVLALYVEATDPHPLRGEPLSLNLCWQNGRARQLLLPTDQELTGIKNRLSTQIKAWLEDAELLKVLHDAKSVWVLMHRAGYTIQGMVGDTLLEAYLTNPALAKLSLEDLSLQYLNQLILPAPDPVWEGCRRAEAV
ncbi:MAG: DNA polymerase I, partial [Syntrophomonadaceae bacterium]|nr:DNA polymerase I [Syntrophomonadaceae bacterium]